MAGRVTVAHTTRVQIPPFSPIKKRGNMRKRLKLKKRSCSLCKPHKMHISNRWKAKELQGIELAEKEIKDVHR